jgi:hypothetical protein
MWRENIVCAARERAYNGTARQKRQREFHRQHINLIVVACKFKTCSFADDRKMALSFDFL